MGHCDLDVCLWSIKQQRRSDKSSNIADSAKNLFLAYGGTRLQNEFKICKPWSRVYQANSDKFCCMANLKFFLSDKTSSNATIRPRLAFGNIKKNQEVTDCMCSKKLIVFRKGLWLTCTLKIAKQTTIC